MAEFGLKLRVRRDDSELKNRTLTRRKLGWAGQDVTIWILSAIFFVGCHGYQEQRFAMEPQDQSAIVGSRVTLPCRVEHKVGNLQWTKDDFGLGTHRNLSGYERYAMIGSDDEGDYSLDIRDVALEDDGLYQCQVSSGLNGEPPIRSRTAHLSVLIAPEPPRILQGAFIEALENQPVTIECVSEGGKPAAEITWVDGNEVVIRDNVESKVEMMPDEQRFKTRTAFLAMLLEYHPQKPKTTLLTSRSVLRLVPSAHLERITCQAQNTADRAFRMATLAIEVKYPPKINISRISDTVAEGGDVRVRCQVDANPPADKYTWYLNNKPVIGDYKEELVIFNVSRTHNKAAIRCEISNSAGKSEAGLTLNVTYPPSFRTRPQNVESVVGSNVTLFCDVDGHPKPKIRWLFHEPGRIGVKGKTASFNVIVNKTTAGRYICKATVEGYPEIESEAIIFIKGPPKFLSNRTQSGIEGETVSVECSSLCVPKPDDVRWYFEGREISAILDPDYATLVELLPDGVTKSSLVIRASQSKHYGVYNCSITNEYGNENVAITLKPSKSLPLVIILIGVTCGIIIFSAFVILLILCHRRRRKNSHINEKPDVTVTNTDMYKESDRSSNISDLKLQLPQSDGSYDLEYTSSDRSDSKPQSGLPLAGPVIPNIHSESLMFRYSNDYSDPTYADSYFKNPNAYVYDYPQGYAPPPHLRVQSPTLEVPPTRSHQGSLTRSIDTASTLPLSAGNGSQNNSLQRTNKPDETDAINNLGLPVGGEGPQVPVYAQTGPKHPGVDVRYAATYGNPYLRNSSMGYQVHTAKPASTPAPPPYSRTLPGNGTQTTHATHV